jgi:peptidoglycan/LPS O-acetylase OafA/YrhL
VTSHRKTKTESGRLSPLDGLRALAVTLVLFHHLDDARWPGGFFGVDVFFSISGYLITTLLVREWQRTGRIWLRGFYTRRLLRLMPALVVLVVVIAPLAIRKSLGHPLREGTYALLYITDFANAISNDVHNPFSHTWSLAVEEQFYLLWPAVLVLGLRRRWSLGWIAFSFAVLCIAVTAAFGANGSSQTLLDLYWLPTTHVPEIFVGVLLAFALGNKAWRQRLSFLARPVLAWASVVLLVAASLEVNSDDRWLYLGGFGGAAIVFTAMIGHVVVAPRTLFSRAFSIPPVVWLGRRSYAFYLWHFPISLLEQYRFKNLHEGWVAIVIASLIMTQLSWRFVEEPFRELKDRRFEPALVASGP